MSKNSGADERVQELIEQLQDPDANVRWIAVVELGQMKEKAVSAIPALTIALTDSDMDVRKKTVFALEKIGEAAAPALVCALKNEDRTVCRLASESLVEMGEAGLRAVIDAARKQELTPDVAKATIEAIKDRMQCRGVDRGVVRIPEKPVRKVVGARLAA